MSRILVGSKGLLVVAGEDCVVRNAAREEGGEVHLFIIRLEELVWQEAEIVVEAAALAEAMAIAAAPGIVLAADWNIVDGEALCVTSVRDDECEVDVRELKVVDQSFGSRMEVTAYSLDRNCEFAQAA